MKKLLALLLFLPTLAQAADNAVILTPGTGVTMRSIDVGAGVQSSGVNIINSVGSSILGTAGTANASVLSIQGIASGTPITETNSAAILAAIQGPIPTQAATVPIGGVNILGVNSATALAGNGVTGTGSLRVTIASDNSPVVGIGIGATAAAVPANASYTGLNVGGNLVGQIGDPCQTVAKTYTPISIITATTTRIVAPTSAKKTYVCYMYLQTTAANNIAVVEGTGGTCGSSTAGIVGGTTAANGLNNAANSGQAFGNGGYATLATSGTNVDLCLITSASTPLAGHVVWVAQ